MQNKIVLYRYAGFCVGEEKEWIDNCLESDDVSPKEVASALCYVQSKLDFTKEELLASFSDIVRLLKIFPHARGFVKRGIFWRICFNFARLVYVKEISLFARGIEECGKRYFEYFSKYPACAKSLTVIMDKALSIYKNYIFSEF